MTLRWGPTGSMLGDALTKDKADAADLLRACVRASPYQRADESSTLQRAREEREFDQSGANVKFEVNGEEKLTRTVLEGIADVARAESTTAKATLSDFLLKQEKAKVTLQLVVNTANPQVVTVASLEDRAFIAYDGGSGKGLRKMNAWRA